MDCYTDARTDHTIVRATQQYIEEHFGALHGRSMSAVPLAEEKYPDVAGEASNEVLLHGSTTDTVGVAQAEVTEQLQETVVEAFEPPEPADPAAEPGARLQDTETASVAMQTDENPGYAEDTNTQDGEDETAQTGEGQTFLDTEQHFIEHYSEPGAMDNEHDGMHFLVKMLWD